MILENDISLDVSDPFCSQVDEEILREAALSALTLCCFRQARALSITVTDTRSIHLLNLQYRGIDEPTDVLAFETEFSGLNRPDGIEELGVLAIAFPLAQSGAQERGVQTIDELALLVVHGTLHLLGYDHNTEEKNHKMIALEESALRRIGRVGAARGISNHPYKT